MNESIPENTTPEVIRPDTGRVEVSADLLKEAVSQLQRLTEIRQRETERQERAIAQMQKAIKRQSILSRYVILTCTLAVLLSVGLAYLMRESLQKESDTAGSLTKATQTLETQSSSIEDMTAAMSAGREIQSALLEKVDKQLTAVREERDEVRGEVRTVLEEKTREFTEKELALAAERDAIVEAAKRSKEEQKALIQETITRLAAMSENLGNEGQPTPEENPAEQAPAETISGENAIGEIDQAEQQVPPAEVPAPEPAETTIAPAP